MKDQFVETDVLCVGGGIVGLMAGIRASELGAKVVVAEKANTLRSGAAATGNDHFLCSIPEIHGSDITSLIEAMMETQLSDKFGFLDRDIVRTLIERSFEIVKLWDSWGIPMKYEGKYEFAGHSFPGRPFFHLKYAGQNQKPILTKEAIKRGVEIINRVMVFELLGDGEVIGAIGVNTREDKLMVFKAKSVILGTGTVSRLYPGLTPGWMFNATRPGTTTGDGRAMAYRIGAELVDVEMPGHHVGPKYFARSGQATWVGVLREPNGNPVGPFITKPNKKYSDMIIEVKKGLFLEYAKSGKGPVYMDCTGISDQDHEYMMHWMQHEGNSALVNYLREEGIDVRKNPIEFTTYGFRGSGGRIWQNVKGETSVKGLYATGDESMPSGGIAEAAICGWIAGENAANYTKEVGSPRIDKSKTKIEEWKSLLGEIRSREVGPDWKEVNIALQQIMSDYAGSIRSETLLEAGLLHLRRLKKNASDTMGAKNQHELVRGIEVLNLLDLGELVFIAARERKETRRLHVRPDYPFTNPLLEKLLVIKKIDEKLTMEWRRVRR